MPIYDYTCGCGFTRTDVWAEIDERHIKCIHCPAMMTRDVGAPMINMGPVPTGGYYDETLGKHIETKREWERECKKQGVTPRGDTPKLEDGA